MKYHETCIANLGDINPLDYGGAFVMLLPDTETPELWVLEEPAENATTTREYALSQILLDTHTFVEGVLSDNPYHPYMPAWYANAESLTSIASTVGCSELSLINRFCSDNPVKRASAYLNAIAVFGVYEFDQSPIRFATNNVGWRARINKWSRQAAAHNEDSQCE